MSPESLDVVKRAVDNLFPAVRTGGCVDAQAVHGHLLAVMVILTTWDHVLAKTFPGDGQVNADALYEVGVDPAIVTPRQIELLAPHRSAFALAHIAWADFAGYTDPPCPVPEKMDHLVDFTKALGAIANPVAAGQSQS